MRSVLTPQRDPEFNCLLNGTLTRLRWSTLAALLIMGITQPLSGRAGLPTWALVLVFIGYNLTIEILRSHIAWLRLFPWVPIVDLPVIAVLYGFNGAPGGPLLVLTLLVVSCAAASFTLAASIMYTAAAVALVGLTSPTLPGWRGISRPSAASWLI